jgi:hypothetical protein
MNAISESGAIKQTAQPDPRRQAFGEPTTEGGAVTIT